MTYLGPARPVLVHGEGCHVWDRQGRRYLDATSGAFCVTFGYTRPDLVEAMRSAAGRLPFARASIFDSEAAESYRSLLLGAAGAPYARVLLTSSGSEAVDAAMKIAIAYQRAVGRPERTAVRSLAGHYHGATLGALRVTGWEARREPYRESLGPRLDGLPRPGDGSAAFIAETIPVAGGGVALPEPGELTRRRGACDAAEALWIADEVLTGFGRCGALFAWQRLAEREDARGERPDRDANPDLVVFGKAAGAGFAALAGVLVAARVAETLDGAAAAGGERFSHVQTYGGNPIACAVGRAVLEALHYELWFERARSMEAELRELAAEAALPGGEGVEAYGALVGFGSKTTGADYLARGLLVHQADGDRRVVAPPLAFGEAEFEELRSAISPRGR
ncbi:MAG TPA: aminotransferase class III-fold pyridoxal phosphate-dependent enzyme [Candidatus Eisenbacteria bacterium]|nr:aminotransferase class III-fold pyridoxal phosphate-dependent enzyme [Candidatus Eisenbacteria bacterium]